MLVLSRKKNESIVINNDITVVVVEIRGDKVRLGVEAPLNVAVHRQEVFDAICRDTKAVKEAEVGGDDASQPTTATPTSTKEEKAEEKDEDVETNPPIRPSPWARINSGNRPPLPPLELVVVVLFAGFASLGGFVAVNWLGNLLESLFIKWST
jgi:carbon storage regulator